MAEFPDTIYEPRVVENLPGLDFVEADTKTIFAEDVNFPSDEIVAIQTILGTNPEGIFATVKAWLLDITADIVALEFLAGVQNLDGGSASTVYGGVDVTVDGGASI